MKGFNSKAPSIQREKNISPVTKLKNKMAPTGVIAFLIIGFPVAILKIVFIHLSGRDICYPHKIIFNLK
jgi:hypothetical protein